MFFSHFSATILAFLSFFSYLCPDFINHQPFNYQFVNYQLSIYMLHPIDLALQIATQAHCGQLDRDNYPAILHPIAVGLMGDTEQEKITGFLHDVVEDTQLTFDDLLEAGIAPDIVNALRLLSHDKLSMSYDDYITSIIESGNPIALQVKYNDLRHNYARGKSHPDLQLKHGKALERVKAAIESCSTISLYTPSAEPGTEVAVFAGGCFWGVQHHFGKMPGVKRTLVGYTGSEETQPTYHDVRNHLTHHVEAVLVEYNPDMVTYTDLCKLFFEIHDPAQTDGVGEDIGAQYRSCVFYGNSDQLTQTIEVIGLLRSKGYEVNTLVLPLNEFWIGEEYHQRYYEKTGGEPYCHFRTRKF